MKLNIEQKRYDTELVKNIKEGNVFKDLDTNKYYIRTDYTLNGIVCVNIESGKSLTYNKDMVVKPVKAEVKIEEYDY